MPFRFILAMSVLVLHGCATTTPTPPPSVAAEPGVEAAVETHSSVATVDEHLYEPEPSAGPAESGDDAYASVWERLIDRFALEDCSAHDINLQWASWYASKPDYMGRIFKRARPWVFYIAEELERRNMPGELALLPMVESAYDPFAYSHGQALGTWQFIASTGRRFGLKQDWWYDGRRTKRHLGQ